MIQVQCSCGSAVEVPHDSPAELVTCPHCERALRVISTDGHVATPEWTVLVIAEGPVRVGEQLFIRGNGPLTIGSAQENSIILPGPEISPQHCQLVRAGDGWRVELLPESGALAVNDSPVAAHDLQRGDVLRIGQFELEYTGSRAEPSVKPATGRSASAALADSFKAPPPSQLSAVKCPSCGRSLPLDARICVDCGINLKTGRPLLTARGVDENELYARTETFIRALSWVLPFGIYPVASEAFGTQKPYVIWAVALLTLGASIFFWDKNLNTAGAMQGGHNLMLWVGHLPAAPSEKNFAMPSETGEFHVWQPLTYELLHDGILNLAENMVFLLVLGSRVNALVGQLKTAILYPLLAAMTAVVYLVWQSRNPLHPVVGPAGAIMGLAGIYLILFPAHRVHTVAWVRTGLSSGFQLAQNVFAVPGITVVVLYLGFDALLTLLQNGVAPDAWMHFAGFPIGLAIGLTLLLTRQAHARGGDILSLSLGRYAWPLVGRPSQRIE